MTAQAKVTTTAQVQCSPGYSRQRRHVVPISLISCIGDNSGNFTSTAWIDGSENIVSGYTSLLSSSAARNPGYHSFYSGTNTLYITGDSNTIAGGSGYNSSGTGGAGSYFLFRRQYRKRDGRQQHHSGRLGELRGPERFLFR